MISYDDVFPIGRLGKPHGVKGELTFHVDDDVFDRVEATYLVVEADGILVPFFLEEYRWRGETTVLVKFCDVNTQDRARELTNSRVFFERRLTPEDDDVPSWARLTGFKVVSQADGLLVGTISSVDLNTINTLFEVTTPDGREVLLPAADELIGDIDIKNHTISMSIPEGLLQL